MQITVIDPLTKLSTQVESNEAQQVHGADADGNYLGLVPIESAAIILVGPPPDDVDQSKWTFDRTTGRWLSAPTVVGERAQLLDVIRRRMTAIEAVQMRHLRELVLALAQGKPADATPLSLLEEKDSDIAVLRDLMLQVQTASTLDDIRALKETLV